MDRTAAVFTFLILGLAVLCPQQKHGIGVQADLLPTTECCRCDDADPIESKRCSNTGSECSNLFHFCPEYCVTHKYFVNNTWSISKRCGRQTECETNWYRTVSNPSCFKDDKPTSDTNCFFCCRSPSRFDPHFCSGPTLSQYNTFSIKTTVPTTTLPTMKSTTTTTVSTTIMTTTPTTTKLTSTTIHSVRVRSCEICVSDNGTDCAQKTITHCNIQEPYCLNSITSRDYTSAKKIRKSCATDAECYYDWFLDTKPKPNCQGNVTGTGVCHYCCETLDRSATPCNTEAIPTTLKSYTIPGAICQTGDHHFKDEICPQSTPLCLNTVSLDPHSGKEIVRKRCAEEIECLNDWWNNTRTRPECFHTNGTGLTVQAISHGQLCHYCCSSNGTTTPCNIKTIPDQSLLLAFTTASTTTSTTASTKSSITTSAHDSSTVNSVTIAPPPSTKSSITTSAHDSSTVNSVTIAPPPSTKSSTTSSAHDSSTVNSVTIAPPQPVKTSVSHAATEATPIPTTASTTHLKNNVTMSAIKTTSGDPFSCYVCPYGGNYFVPVSQQCADNQHFCLNTIEDKRDGTRVMEKRCVTEDDCFQKWWQESSDQEVCKKLYELGDAPSHQDLLCHFCCTFNYCNYFTTPDTSQLYDGNTYHSSP